MAKKETKNADSQEKNLDVALKQIDKEYGEGTVRKLGDTSHTDVPTISTGALSMDIALGIGGVPRGRVTEVYGPEASGKTSVCLHVIANAQKANGVCAFIDTENALDPHYAELIGVNTTDLLVSQPDCGEDALNIAETLVRSNAIDVLVVDSVAALVPRAEIEGQMGDSHVGLQARLMSQALRKLTGVISRSRTAMVFTNQMREKVGVMFGSPETTPGGRALKFYSSVRIEVRRTSTIKAASGEALGNRVKAKIVKNKLAAPFKVAEFDIMYGRGISRAGSILDVALEMKLIEKRGSWFSFDGEQIGQGREQTKQAIQDSPDLEERILQRIRENLSTEEARLAIGERQGTADEEAAEAASESEAPPPSVEATAEASAETEE